ncbi:SPASM domain-containing protein [Rhodoblastus acidophilus]|nr:radical SAM protein [Rhodoblastus acidophilus]
MTDNPVVNSAATTANFSEQQRRLNASIHKAHDPLPPCLAEANKFRGFDRKFRTDAIIAWLDQEEAANPSFDRLSFLQMHSSSASTDPAVFVALALEYKAAGLKEEALSAINRAMALHQTDLHSQRVFMDIRFWADPSAQNPKELDAYLAEHFCAYPFEHFETVPDGNIFVCCPSYLPVPIGNLKKETAERIWAGDAAQLLRESILDGSFRYCSRLHCGRISNRTLNLAKSHSAHSIKIKGGKQEPEEQDLALPKVLVLSHDRSCNLACPSCRKDFIIAKKEEQTALNIFLEESIIPILSNARLINITGSGDPFGSNHFRALLKILNRDKYPHLQVDLHTNGQLFDERAWAELSLHGMVRNVEISIDAAKAETYAVVRRGGSFDRLLRNLKFISNLRKAGEIKQLAFSFVAQALNFEEMPAFVRMAEYYGVDRVEFNMIRNWGTFSAEEFSAEFIGSKFHPLYERFLEILESEEMSREIVSRGNLTLYQ